MKNSIKYYIIAGEASGDLHGSNLIKAIKNNDAQSNIRVWGGDKMEAAGAALVKHYRDLAFMGFIEVVKNLNTILKNISFCKKDILSYKPDVLVLIDYPGFNLRIAKWAHQQNIKVAYYISPQVWAWKEGRVKMMKQCIDRMIVILPFEKEYFKKKWNWDVDYVGHPLMEEIERKKTAGTTLQIKDVAGNIATKPIIALLPGSRRQEIEKKLPVMLAAGKKFPQYQLAVAQAPAVEVEFYQQFIKDDLNVSIVNNQTYDLLMQSSAALVTSGTATLETALFEVPEVVCYKGSEISYQIAKRVINIKYISLVNLIMDKEVVKELIQQQMNEENILRELDALLHHPEKIARIKKDYKDLKQLLTGKGSASAKAANIIAQLIAQ